MFLVGLISCYREGALVQNAIRCLLEACDHVLVLDAPFGAAPDEGEPSDFGKLRERNQGRLTVWIEPEVGYADDASKATALIHRAQQRFTGKDGQLWGLWLDADERLLWPEHVRDFMFGLPANAGGMPIKIQELDGSFAVTQHRVILLDVVERYVVGKYQVKLRDIATVLSLPNVPGGPDDKPVLGEPMIAHFASVRRAGRREHRVHTAELEYIQQEADALGLTAQEAGLAGYHLPRP